MLSKEEIERKLEQTEDDETTINLLYLKIDLLESDKQKLIEKLEKRRKQNNNRYGQAIDNDEFPEMYEYDGQVQEDDYILSILKGENHE